MVSRAEKRLIYTNFYLGEKIKLANKGGKGCTEEFSCKILCKYSHNQRAWTYGNILVTYGNPRSLKRERRGLIGGVSNELRSR